MDTFMDKLAQKLTAQEMIKANAAADAEELGRLQNQVQEYNECLAQMQKVNEELLAATGQMNHLLEGTIAPQVDKLVETGIEKLQASQVDTGKIDALVAESLAKIQEIQQDTQALEALKGHLVEKMEQSEEYMHKESVKVYRNVQAALVEENGKQNDTFKELNSSSAKKLNIVLGISIAALVAGVGGFVFQVLTYLHVI